MDPDHRVIRRADCIWRVWSQNAIKAKVKKLSYPCENIDDRQENTTPLPICFQNAMYAFDISHFADKWNIGYSKKVIIWPSAQDHHMRLSHIW